LSRRRLNSKEAADVLGISVDAVRMRARRGTLEAEHDANGRLYIWLDADEAPESDAGAVVSEMRGRIEDLREQLQAEREANRENRRIIAALTSRIPELEAPSEARGSPETVEEEPEAEPRGPVG
jgi:hypothetical protein